MFKSILILWTISFQGLISRNIEHIFQFKLLEKSLHINTYNCMTHTL